MKLHKRYSFLYLPDGDGRSREFRVPRWAILAAGGLALVLLVVAGLYVLDCRLGVAWRPGGAALARENEHLRQTIEQFDARLAGLRFDLDQVFAYQQLVAAVVDVEPLDAQMRAGGIGGRRPLVAGGETPVGTAAFDLESLVRQARIQHRGMVALLDTLTARQEIRDRIPSIRPCDVGWLSSRFGMRRDPFTGKQAFHRGIDFGLPLGTPVRVTAEGTVVAVEKQRGLGRVIKIDHGGGVTTVYGHLQDVKVRKGQQVARGDVIASSGSSGRSTAPHLHYEVRVGERAVNPLTYIVDTYAELN